MTEFEKILLDEISYLRSKAQANTAWREFAIDIEVRGRVHEGDLRIEFSVGESYGADSSAKAHSLRAALHEWTRRKSWNEANRPLMLGYNGELKADSAEEDSF